MKRWLVISILLFLPRIGWAQHLPVVASFSIVADITRQIGGERVDVISLVGPGQDTHVFQPSPADVQRLARAKVFVTNGLGLEGWLTRLAKSANFHGVQVTATDGIKPLQGSVSHAAHDHGHADEDAHEHAIDPHAWHDPRCVEIYIKNVTRGLIKADPAGKIFYEQRAAAFTERVRKLDQWAAGAFAAIPATRRTVVTAHDAFGYLAHRYDIHFLTLQGMSTDSEASAKHLAQLVRQLRKENINTVFFETMSDKRLVQQVAKEAKLRVEGPLYADALTVPAGVAGSWEKMFRYNISILLKSLQ